MAQPYGKLKHQSASVSVREQQQRVQRDLEIHRKMSSALQELTSSRQLKAFRMNLQMTPPEDLASQAADPLLKECVQMTQFAELLAGTNWLD